jgi:hypothetical protein
MHGPQSAARVRVGEVITPETPAAARHLLTGLRSLRIIALHQDGYAQVAHLSWAGPGNPTDASLYIRPYVGPQWTARASVNALPPYAASQAVATDTAPAVFREAKLSLHHSGQTHAYIAEDRRTVPVMGLRLDDPAGGHVATIVAFDLAGLPLLETEPSTQAPDIDLLVLAPGQDGNYKLNVALFVGTDEAAMREQHQLPEEQFLLRFDREGMQTPLFIAPPVVAGQ